MHVSGRFAPWLAWYYYCFQDLSIRTLIDQLYWFSYPYWSSCLIFCDLWLSSRDFIPSLKRKDVSVHSYFNNHQQSPHIFWYASRIYLITDVRIILRQSILRRSKPIGYRSHETVKWRVPHMSSSIGCITSEIGWNYTQIKFKVESMRKYYGNSRFGFATFRAFNASELDRQLIDRLVVGKHERARANPHFKLITFRF